MGRIWGVEVECFSALRSRVEPRPGDAGTSRDGRRRSAQFVLRLSWLGFRFMAGILGLMKEGVHGSIVLTFVVLDAADGGCIDKPFMFRRRGPGEVTGRVKGALVSGIGSIAAECVVSPKEVPG